MKFEPPARRLGQYLEFPQPFAIQFGSISVPCTTEAIVVVCALVLNLITHSPCPLRYCCCTRARLHYTRWCVKVDGASLLWGLGLSPYVTRLSPHTLPLIESPGISVVLRPGRMG